MEEVIAKEQAMIKRGVKMRTLYQHAARRSSESGRYDGKRISLSPAMNSTTASRRLMV